MIGKSRPGRPEPKSRLPRNWYLDPMFAEVVYGKIDRLKAEGMMHLDIALQVGCTARTVRRHLLRSGHDTIQE